MLTEIKKQISAGELKLLNIKVQPGAKQTKIKSVSAGVICLAVTAAPDKGKANVAVIALLAKELKIPKTSLVIKRGGLGHNKVVEIL